MPVLQDNTIKKALKAEDIDLKRAKYYELRLDDLEQFLDHVANDVPYQIGAAPEFADLRGTYNYPATHNIFAKAVTGKPGAKLIARMADLIDDVDKIKAGGQDKSKSVIIPYIAAMNAAHPGPNYADPSPAEVNALYANNTLTRHALNMITRNFIDRLDDFFGRLRLDWEDINKLFFPDCVLVQLSRILITDSDSHKKGAHVYILFFEVAPRPIAGPLPAPPTGWRAWFSRGPRFNQLDQSKLPVVRLVYKPGDLELDYRLVADTVETHNRLPAPRTPLPFTLYGSLLELVQPAANFLPTYFILPRHPGSRAAARADGSMPIDVSYGYLQFLDHEPVRQKGTGEPIKKDSFGNKLDWKNCDLNKLDWITTNLADIDTFCQIFGWYMALGITFSLNDSHAENVMVYQRKPHLIDVEISFKSPTDSIPATMLGGAVISRYNGVSHEPYYNQLYYLADRRRNPVSALRLDAHAAAPNPASNMGHGHHAHYFGEIRQGWDDAIAHMTLNQAALNNWLGDAGLQNTYCRYTSEPTAAYWGLYRTLYGVGHCLSAGPPPVAPPAPGGPPAPAAPAFGPPVTYGTAVGAAWYRRVPFEGFFGGRVSGWQVNRRPNWATMTHIHGLADLLNADVPVFYHRVNSNDLINARGVVVSSATPPAADVPRRTWAAVDNPTFNANVAQFRVDAGNYGAHYFLAPNVAATFAAAQVARLTTAAMAGIQTAGQNRITNWMPTAW